MVDKKNDIDGNQVTNTGDGKKEKNKEITIAVKIIFGEEFSED